MLLLVLTKITTPLVLTGKEVNIKYFGVGEIQCFLERFLKSIVKPGSQIFFFFKYINKFSFYIWPNLEAVKLNRQTIVLHST